MATIVRARTVGLKVEPAARTMPPPTDAEKYAYIRGRRHRWVWLVQLVSFTGVGISLYGLSRMTYWTLLFLLPLALYGTEVLLGVWTSTFRPRIDLAFHEALLATWQPKTAPSVDVFIPTCGEPLAVLRNTFRYVQGLAYPGTVRVYVLDDMGDARVRAAAGDFGFDYFARPGNAFKKAGNLQYAFERTSGEHILLLDADFAPRPEMLVETVPYLDADPTIGIVQTPQFYPSREPGMGWLERCASATQELFYRFIQPSRDSVEAAVCCGTSALYRRAALASSGGFPLVEHSEDMVTGVNLIGRGYRLAYIPVVLTQGMCPAEIDPFIGQQYRWCAGSIRLMRTASFHELALTYRQRAAFWSGFLHYLATSMNGFFAPLPLLLMVWIFPQYVHPMNMLPLLGLIVLWLVVYPLLLTNKWRLDVLRVQTIYGFAHAFAVYDAFFGSEAEWLPSHGRSHATRLTVRVKRVMVGYLSVAFGLAVAGVAYRLSGPYTFSAWWALLAFMVVNMYVFCPVVWMSLTSLRNDRRSCAVVPAQIRLPD